ncbi:MAG: hypothetical protein H7Z75_04260 [Ferruginibacter sp.]|nr:hypothetical protein [Cytophagales bacterium]
MTTLAIIITVAMAVTVLIGVGITELRSRNKPSHRKTNMPEMGNALNKEQDAKDAQRTTRVDDFNPGKV